MTNTVPTRSNSSLDLRVERKRRPDHRGRSEHLGARVDVGLGLGLGYLRVALEGLVLDVVGDDGGEPEGDDGDDDEEDACGRRRDAGRDRASAGDHQRRADRSEEHTSELQSLMRISYAVLCLKKKKNNHNTNT